MSYKVSKTSKAQEISFLSAKAAQNGEKTKWLALFSKKAIIEDPVGKSPLDPIGKGHIGIQAIERFWDKMIGPFKLDFIVRESYPCGNECANVASITNIFEDGKTLTTDLVIIYKINRQNKLVSLRAYWNFDKTL